MVQSQRIIPWFRDSCCATSSTSGGPVVHDSAFEVRAL